MIKHSYIECNSHAVYSSNKVASYLYYFRMQCSYFCPIMLNIMLIRKLVHHYVLN